MCGRMNLAMASTTGSTTASRPQINDLGYITCTGSSLALV